MRFKSVAKFIQFARNHRIPIKPKDRKKGVFLALIGWCLIAIASVFFRVPLQTFPAEINFIVQYSSGAAFLLIGCILYGIAKEKKMNGYKFLAITKENARSKSDLISTKQRIKLIYVRGFIATSGYIVYEIAKSAIGSIDNSIAHGADALMYALISFIVLKQRFNLIEFIGIFIAFFGVSYILYYDLQSPNSELGIWGFVFGICSSLALAIVLIMTSIIVQFDHPVRIAFHQCMSGFIISIIFFLFTLKNFNLDELSNINFNLAILSGICYAVALICFFQSFKYMEPIIFAISTYSLILYVILFESIIDKSLLSYNNIISSLIISIGCGILIHQEYRKDKT